MKHHFYILTLCSLLLVLGSALRAQDVQRFSERQIIGTARYVGMGGAMTAIGGDPSAVLDNPAGLGLYRRSELALTVDETIDQTSQGYATPHHGTPRYTRSRFAAPHVSAIWAWGNPTKQRGLVYSNLMFSINRLANFNRDVVVNGQNMGMVETICLHINSLLLAPCSWFRTESSGCAAFFRAPNHRYGSLCGYGRGDDGNRW